MIWYVYCGVLFCHSLLNISLVSPNCDPSMMTHGTNLVTNPLRNIFARNLYFQIRTEITGIFRIMSRSKLSGIDGIPKYHISLYIPYIFILILPFSSLDNFERLFHYHQIELLTFNLTRCMMQQMVLKSVEKC